MKLRLGYSDHAEDAGRTINFPAEALLRHAFLCGKTGSGKTVTLLHWCMYLAEQLVKNPDTAPGFTFIDPHGDAVNDL